MNTYCPVPGIGSESPADNDYKPGFSAKMMAKDLILAQDAANFTRTNTRIGRLASEIYQQFIEVPEKASKDFSAILNDIKNSDR